MNKEFFKNLQNQYQFNMLGIENFYTSKKYKKLFYIIILLLHLHTHKTIKHYESENKVAFKDAVLEFKKEEPSKSSM